MILKYTDEVKNQITKFFKNHIVIVILIMLVCYFTYSAPHFLTFHNLRYMILQNTYLFIIVIGLSFIMIGGGIDLSIGYQISLVSGIVGILFSNGWNSISVITVGFFIGIICGIFNGFLITFFEMKPLMATLATQIIFRGVAYSLTKGQTFFVIPESFKIITQGSFLGMKYDFWIIMFCMVTAFLVHKYTYYGKYIKAMGLNEIVLKGYGVNITNLKIISYCIGSVFFALAAMILVSKSSVASANYGVGYEVTGIAAAFIGGAYEKNENINIWDMMIAVLIISVIDNGMLQLGSSKFLQYIIIGIVFIASMALQKIQKYISLKRKNVRIKFSE